MEQHHPKGVNHPDTGRGLAKRDPVGQARGHRRHGPQGGGQVTDRVQWCMDDWGGRAGTYKRADRSVMGMLVSTLGLLPAATAKAAGPPRWETVAPNPPVDRDMRRT